MPVSIQKFFTCWRDQEFLWRWTWGMHNNYTVQCLYLLFEYFSPEYLLKLLQCNFFSEERVLPCDLSCINQVHARPQNWFFSFKICVEHYRTFLCRIPLTEKWYTYVVFATCNTSSRCECVDTSDRITVNWFVFRCLCLESLAHFISGIDTVITLETPGLRLSQTHAQTVETLKTTWLHGNGNKFIC